VVRDAALAPLLAQHGLDLTALRHAADQPLTITRLAQLRITVDLAPSPVQRLSAPNVVGRLEGSDPLLKREYVVFSAHMDHVGVGRPNASGDSIYNGADDDASGTAAVIELAEAFARLNPRPKRSLLFLTVSGEERGLWGSSYFTSHPPVPVAQMVADLNLDMVGRNWKDTIVVIGRQHSDLGATLARVNAAHPELRMAAIDDLWPEERFYFRSDHYNFARRGVPILFFFNGVHQDYHQPSDEPAKIDAEKESRIAKLVFYLGLEVANSPQRPQWKPDSYREIVQPR
jgi:Zn-dependent M28 family amino/carboxypeptidase